MFEDSQNEENMTPEVGDTVEFSAHGKWQNVVDALGTVTKVYKNGKINVTSEFGDKYSTAVYTVISRAG